MTVLPHLTVQFKESIMIYELLSEWDLGRNDMDRERIMNLIN
jgi:hypothetical protein